MQSQTNVPKKRLSVEGFCIHSYDRTTTDKGSDLYQLRWNIGSKFKDKQDQWFAENQLFLCMVRQRTVNLPVPDYKRVMMRGMVKGKLCYIDAVIGTIYDLSGKCQSSDNIRLLEYTMEPDQKAAMNILKSTREPESTGMDLYGLSGSKDDEQDS